jgi:hypothetical protein
VSSFGRNDDSWVWVKRASNGKGFVDGGRFASGASRDKSRSLRDDNKRTSNGKTKADPYGMTTKEQAKARQKQIPTG